MLNMTQQTSIYFGFLQGSLISLIVGLHTVPYTVYGCKVMVSVGYVLRFIYFLYLSTSYLILSLGSVTPRSLHIAT